MRDERVFISSVMDGFEPQRQAAQAAVGLLRMRPVMAEDFSAKSYSSQQACLEGVRQSNIMVLVLARRAGFIAPSGKSVVEEEYDEARRLGIPVLSFLERGKQDAKQEAFVKRLRDYTDGYLMPSFSESGELKDLVIKALNDEVGTGANRTLDLDGARAVLDQHAWGSTKPGQYSTWFGGMLVPSRREELISIRELGSPAFQNKILREIVYGDKPIFGPEQIEREEREESTVFKQLEHLGPIASLEVCMDGTLIYGKQIGGLPHGSFSLLQRYVIDHDEFQATLEGFLRYAHTFYGSFEASSMLTSFFFGGSLTGMNDKAFGRIPNPEPTGMSMPGHSLGDPLRWPKQPQKLARADLVDGQRAADEITEMVARMFRAAGAYYTEKARMF